MMPRLLIAMGFLNLIAGGIAQTTLTTCPTYFTTRPSTATTRHTTSTTKRTPPTSRHTLFTTKRTTPTTRHTISTTKRTTPTTRHTTFTTKRSTATTRPPTRTTVRTSIAPNHGSHPEQTFLVYDTSNYMSHNCVLMKGEFMFQLNYPTNRENSNTVVGIAAVCDVSGFCGYYTNMVVVSFLVDGFSVWTLIIEISKNRYDEFHWTNVTLVYAYDSYSTFPHLNSAKYGQWNTATLQYPWRDLMSASDAQSNKCHARQTLDLGYGNKLYIWNLQYDAFVRWNHSHFSAYGAELCTYDDKSDSPYFIAIGICVSLGGLCCLFGIYRLFKWCRYRRSVYYVIDNM